MRSLVHAASFWLVLLGSGCSASEASNNVRLDPHIQLIDPARGAELLDQCSRGSPPAGERYFRPNTSDIAAFERALQIALDGARVFQAELAWRKSRGNPLEPSLAKGWGRDMIGIERGGRKTIYGNYYPLETGGGQKPNGPMIVCDGGAQFFGAEFDIAQGTIVHLAFNGPR